MLLYCCIDSLGHRDKIQVSQETADLIVAAGKGHWLTLRPDLIQAKGKGLLQAYWLTPSTKKRSDSNNDQTDRSDTDYMDNSMFLKLEATKAENTGAKMKTARLIDWAVELFTGYLKDVKARREINGRGGATTKSRADTVTMLPTNQETCLDEVTEVIHLPKFDRKAAIHQKSRQEIEIDDIVVSQLRDYITVIAASYKDNPFHNFEHACHVTMSANKFLQRIVAPDLALEQLRYERSDEIASRLYSYTLGINSDPLTLFAILFSALVHDADHRGVSNMQLEKEDPEMAGLFKNKSVAEQNSLAVSWGLLMSYKYADLRCCLFADREDLVRFRQVVVNVVMATDIFDKELNDLRKNRWSKAFDFVGQQTTVDHDGLQNDRRATVVIEHIIQASDVSHTMQHWIVYRKWNERLFHEMTLAYRAGRMGSDPATFWYKGELGFFDNYIIPLAKKLKDCGVFGVSSDECLNYAVRNRDEWKDCGLQIVQDMVKEFSE
jgi:hypothetical protein